MSKGKKTAIALLAVLLLGIALGFIVFLLHQAGESRRVQRHVPVATETPAAAEDALPTEEPEPEPSPEPTPEPTPTPPPYEPPAELLELQNRNPHVIALLDIPGTVIHYPILQYPDPNDDPVEPYYLNRTIDLQAGYPGSIFVFYSEGKDFETFNTVIYGHNMADGTMFGTLNQFENHEFRDAHSEIHIYTNTEEHVYTIAGVCIYDDRHINLTYDDDLEEDRAAFLASLSGTDWVDGVRLTTADHIITLSACVGGMPENRRLVIAVEQEPSDPSDPGTAVILPDEGGTVSYSGAGGAG